MSNGTVLKGCFKVNSDTLIAPMEEDGNYFCGEEIKENDFNCNIPRYVDTFEEPEPVDLDAVKKDIQFHENEAVKLAGEMEKLLKELGI